MGTIEPLNFLFAAKSLVLPPVVIDSHLEEPIMKSQFAIALALSLLAANAFALPSSGPMPLLGEVKDSQPEVLPQGRLPQDRHVAEGGAERLLEQRRNG